jgi:prepilin-type N-terminal cleavage/methylation domain-containing protein
MKLAPRRPRRPGLSLLEVLVALAIFLISLVGIFQIITLGGDHARKVADQGHAIQVCQCKLAEVAAGALPLTSQAEAPVEDDPPWEWSLEAEQGSVTGLWNVTVKVFKRRPNGSRDEEPAAVLTQMILDPAIRGNNMTSTSNTNTTNSNATSNSGNSSGQGSAGGSQGGK